MITLKDVLAADDLREAALIFADQCEENGDERAGKIRFSVEKRPYERHVREDLLELFAEGPLGEYDWNEVFKYATPQKALPNDDISTAMFGQEDVKRIIAHQEGENDGNNWIMAGELHDGRFFFITAGCDYTGWG